MEEKKRTSEGEVEEFMGRIFEVMGCKKAEDPAVPTFYRLGVVPKGERWSAKKK